VTFYFLSLFFVSNFVIRISILHSIRLRISYFEFFHTMPIATITNLDKSFGKRVIFDKLEFLIDRGERVGLIGPNGAGKSTLFKIIMGEITPKAGSSRFPKR
jgi:ABC-type polysaccharide/polyol phosphate transport system ATPase subunit